MDSERYLQQILQTMADGFWIVDTDKNIIEANDAYCRMSGYTRDELLTMKISDLDTEENKDVTIARIRRIMSNGSETFETRHRRKNGTFFDVEISVTFMQSDEKVFLCFCRDISERKRIEAALQESENRFRAAFLVSPVAKCISTLEGGVWIDVNQAEEALLGYTREEMIGKSAVAANVWVDLDDRKKMIETIVQNGEIKNQPVWCRRKDGTNFLASVSARLLSVKGARHILFATEDITERVLSEEKIRQNLREKESLLREIHHRVKNNLAVINGLIGLQASHVKDETVRKIFDTCQYRIKSMALVHERLYKSTELSAVNFQEYIQNIVGDLMSYYRPGGKKIEIDIHAHDIFLDIDTAIPCGLIINELINNAFKHAFSNILEPKINIDFHKVEDIHTLIVYDNGNGMPHDFKKSSSDTLGLMLVRILTRQLKGEVKFESGMPARQGTAVTITFMVRLPNGKTESS